MTVRQPGSWVVGFEGDDDEAVLRQKNHIAPRRIVALEIELFWRIRCLFDLLEYCEVMAVQVDLKYVSSPAGALLSRHYLQDVRRTWFSSQYR